VQSGVVVTMAGNLVEPGGDFNRRLLTIRLGNATGVAPVARTGFKHSDLVGWVSANRPRLLGALHTIMLHGLQNAPAHPVSGMAFSFDWAPKVLGALSHLTDDDDRSMAEVAIDGWLTEVAETDELGEQWGDLLLYLWWNAMGAPVTIQRMRELLAVATPGERPELPGDLLVPTGESDAAVGRKWAGALKKVIGTIVPFEGVNLRIEAEKRDGASKKSLRYTLAAFDPKSGSRLIPGRGIAEQLNTAAPTGMSNVTPISDAPSAFDVPADEDWGVA